MAKRAGEEGARCGEKKQCATRKLNFKFQAFPPFFLCGCGLQPDPVFWRALRRGLAAAARCVVSRGAVAVWAAVGEGEARAAEG